ncbi:hypothetical protein QQ045_026219 [Rhodiola kirilowii]
MINSTESTSTISSSSYEDDLFEGYDDQPGESSWATHIDQLQEEQDIEQEFGLINEENDHVYDHDQPGASSWATYIDQLQEEQDNGFVFDSLMNKEVAKSWSAIKMKKGASPAGSVVIDEELEDTACSPHSSPTVSYMNQMKLKTSYSNVQDNMLGRPALTTRTNVFGDEKTEEKDGKELRKRGGLR